MVQKQGENTLGMPTSLMTCPIATTFANPSIGNNFVVVSIVASLPGKTPIIMTTSFIQQQIDLEIHDIMY